MGQQTPTLDSAGCWVMLDWCVYPVGFCLKYDFIFLFSIMQNNVI